MLQETWSGLQATSKLAGPGAGTDSAIHRKQPANGIPEEKFDVVGGDVSSYHARGSEAECPGMQETAILPLYQINATWAEGRCAPITHSLPFQRGRCGCFGTSIGIYSPEASVCRRYFIGKDDTIMISSKIKDILNCASSERPTDEELAARPFYSVTVNAMCFKVL